jgi:hypothetical protein
MSDKANVFGSNGEGFGDLAGWALQEPDENTQKDRANALDSLGNEAASALYNERTEVTSNYVATTDSAALPTAVGVMLNGFHLTQIEVSTTAEAFATMTLTGHQHAANAHDSATGQSFTHGVTLTNAFGATSFIGGADTAAAASVTSGSITIATDHVDVNGSTGAHLSGKTHNGRLEGTSTWTGNLTTAADSGWDVTAHGEKFSNQGFQETTVTATQKLTVDT